MILYFSLFASRINPESAYLFLRVCFVYELAGRIARSSRCYSCELSPTEMPPLTLPVPVGIWSVFGLFFSDTLVFPFRHQ